jgi:hypothetical protein
MSSSGKELFAWYNILTNEFPIANATDFSFAPSRNQLSELSQ